VAGGIFVSAQSRRWYTSRKRRAQPGLEGRQRQGWLAPRRAARWSVAVQLAQQHLVNRGEKAFDAAAASGFAGQGEDQPDFEIRADLLQMA
jgi:hypothetical protein